MNQSEFRVFRSSHDTYSGYLFFLFSDRLVQVDTTVKNGWQSRQVWLDTPDPQPDFAERQVRLLSGTMLRYELKGIERLVAVSQYAKPLLTRS
jgi:hypothetical protein